MQITQNKLPMSEPALHTPDVQKPQNKQPMSEPAFDSPDAQDPQNKQPMSEAAPHTSAKCRCVSQSAPLKKVPNADWVFRVGSVLAPRKSVHIIIAIMYSFVSSR